MKDKETPNTGTGDMKPKCFGKYTIDCYIAKKEGSECAINDACFKETPKEEITE